MSQAETVVFATDNESEIARYLEESRSAVDRACEGALESLRSASRDIDPARVRWSLFGPPEAGASIGGPLVPDAGVRLCAAYWRWLGEREPTLAAKVEGIALGTAGESAAAREFASYALAALDPARSARATALALDELQAARDHDAIVRLSFGPPRAFDGEPSIDLLSILSKVNPGRIFALLESDDVPVVRAGVSMVEKTRPPGDVERLLSILDRPGTREPLVQALLRMGCEEELADAFRRRLPALEDTKSIADLLQALATIASEEYGGREMTAARRVLAVLLETSAPGSASALVLTKLIAALPELDEEEDGDEEYDDHEDENPFQPCEPAEALGVLDILQSERLIDGDVARSLRRSVTAGSARPTREGTVSTALLAEGASDGLFMHRRNLDRWLLSLCARTRGQIQPEAISCPAHRASAKDDLLRFVAGGRLYRFNVFVNKYDEHEPYVTIASLLNRVLEDSGTTERFVRLRFGDSFAYGDPSAYSNAERRLGFPILEPVPACRIDLRSTVAGCEAAASREFAIRYFGRAYKTPDAGAEVLLARDRNGFTALHHAVISNLPHVIEPILEAGLPVDTPDGDGLTPLYHAAFNDCVDVALTLIDRGADPLSCNGAGLTALHVAAMKGSLNLVRALLNRGFDVDLALEVTEAPPIEHANPGAALLDAVGFKVFGEFRSGQTPLHLAAMNGQDEAMTLLLDAGAVIDTQDEDGRTPLHLAVSYGEDDAAALLRARSASPSIVDRDGQTADARAADPELRRAEIAERAQEMIRLIKEQLDSND